MTYDPALVERMVALVRSAADMDRFNCDHVSEVAKRILAELPEPVDPDEQYARDLIREQGWAAEPSIGSEAVVHMIATAHRVARQEATR
jgi:hypothetical protein